MMEERAFQDRDETSINLSARRRTRRITAAIGTPVGQTWAQSPHDSQRPECLRNGPAKAASEAARDRRSGVIDGPANSWRGAVVVTGQSASQSPQLMQPAAAANSAWSPIADGSNRSAAKFSLNFPRPHDGRIVVVTYPFVFGQ